MGAQLEVEEFLQEAEEMHLRLVLGVSIQISMLELGTEVFQQAEEGVLQEAEATSQLERPFLSACSMGSVQILPTEEFQAEHWTCFLPTRTSRNFERLY